jgi:predicted transcriptional regulator
MRWIGLSLYSPRWWKRLKRYLQDHWGMWPDDMQVEGVF